jgi:hypothetical protein
MAELVYPRERLEAAAQFGLALVDYPAAAADLVDVIAASGDIELSRLLFTLLDEGAAQSAENASQAR